MDGFGPNSYGDAFADVYDRWYGELPGAEDTVRTALRLADGGPVLELACGTGRLCLPLAAAGTEVHGLDASEAMLDRLHAKAAGPGATVTTHLADMRTFTLAGAPPFALVFVAFNSLFNLPSEDAQADCFLAVAAHLRPGGRFAVECIVPGDPPPAVHDALELHTLAADRVVLRVSRQDPADQTIAGQHVEITEAGIRLRPWLLRYSTVAELDAMAATAGFVVEDRWADWAGSTFDADAMGHVTVYRLATTGAGQGATR